MITEVDKAKPMAIVAIEIPTSCAGCLFKNYIFGGKRACLLTGRGINRYCDAWSKPYYCPLQKAVGIVEPNGNVKYLREDNDAGDN